MDAALLAGAHADGLPVLDIAHGVGLGVLQRDEGHNHIGLRLRRKIFVDSDDVFEQCLADLKMIPSLLERDAEHILILLGGGNVVRVHLHHIVVALFLAFQDFQGLVGVAGGDDAVGDLTQKVAGGGGVAHVREGCPVAVGAKPVRAPGPDIGAGDGAERLVFLHKVNLPVYVA